jgi:hypothetical protein
VVVPSGTRCPTSQLWTGGPFSLLQPPVVVAVAQVFEQRVLVLFCPLQDVSCVKTYIYLVLLPHTQVRMLYVGRLQTAHGTRVTHRRDARLEAGRVQ